MSVKPLQLNVAMNEPGQKPTFFQNLKFKYRFAIFNEQTYEELWRLRLSRLNVIGFFGTFAMLLIIGVIILIAFTSLREYIPGYPNTNERLMIVRNSQMVDSLIFEINMRDKFVQVIKNIVTERNLDSTSIEKYKNARFDTATVVVKPILSRTPEDDRFRQEIEKEERFNVKKDVQGKRHNQIDYSYFFSPIKGIITNKFGETQSHLGVDISSTPGARIASIYDGTVIFAGFTVENGYVIQVFHPNNMVSIYKHNSQLLKKIGDKVKAGEAIATVGNSGEFSTGPHLHFELWYNGEPLNPEEYISFK